MSDKFVFQNAKIKHMESKLLAVQAVQRLLDCDSPQDAFKVLIDLGFGSGLTFEGNDFDRLFESEEEKSVAFLKEFNVDHALDVFLLQYDYLNLKAILKATVQGSRDKMLFSPCGLYDTDALCAVVDGEKVDNMPIYVKDAVDEVQSLVAEDKATPHLIDCAVDRVMYKHIFAIVKKSGKLAKDYFIRKIDYLNLLSLLRCRKLGLSYEFFKEGFIEGGNIALNTFEKTFDSSLDSLVEGVKHTVYEDIVKKVAEDGNIISVEVESDNALLKMWRDENNDLFSVAPIVSFYLTKMTEIRLAKLIVAGIKNNVDVTIIKERMRDLYA